MNARIGERLLASGLISPDQLRIALCEQQRNTPARDQGRESLGQVLVGLGFLSENVLRDALSAQLGARSVDLTCCTVEPEAIEAVPLALAKRHRFLPLTYGRDPACLVIASARSHDLAAQDEIRRALGAAVHIQCHLASESDVDRAIDHYYGHSLAIDDIVLELENGSVATPLARLGEERSQPVVRLIEALLTDAVKCGASDIHFEPEAGFLRIRYRIDGLLRQIRALHAQCWPPMLIRLKVLSGMNIAENRAPQDGRISLSIGGRPIDFRAACQPTLHGENVVLRILDRHKGIVPLAGLGLSAAHHATITRMLSRPEGLLLLTGPTGSGKTTTLYALLNHIQHESLHIMTLEDPVEYPLSGLRQTSIVEGGRLDFVNGIRSMMRQDPDEILVGEIRDAATAEMAFRAALTGHQVFSTLHSHSALGALPRLRDIGIPADILAGNLTGIIAQRLVRRLCPACKRTALASPEECRALGLSSAAASEPVPVLYHPVGCAACAQQGYRGRFALLEVLCLDDVLDELIARRAPLSELQCHAREAGFVTLAEDGRRQVLAGQTTLAEVGRVVDLTRRV